MAKCFGGSSGCLDAHSHSDLDMDTLRVWTGGTDTSLPDFSTPIGGQIGASAAPATSSSYFPTAASLRTLTPSWLPFGGDSDPSQQENECFPSLSWTQRIIGFVVLLLIGILFCAFVRPFVCNYLIVLHTPTTALSLFGEGIARTGIFFERRIKTPPFRCSFADPRSLSPCHALITHHRARWSSLVPAHSPSTTHWATFSLSAGMLRQRDLAFRPVPTHLLS